MTVRRVSYAVISLTLLIGAWNGAVKLGIVPYLPYMWLIAQEVSTDFSPLLHGAIATGSRALAGFGIGAGFGVIAALFLAASRTASLLVAPYVLLAKSVPVLSLIPIFILWFGLSETARITFIAASCFFWVVVAAAEAIENVPTIHRWSARTLGSSRSAEYRTVVLPSILPSIFGGLRNSATVSFALAVAAEFLGAQQGLGFYLIHASTYFAMSKMIAAVLVLTLMAIVADQTLIALGRYVFRWTERT